MAVRLTRLNHAVLYVSDMERAHAFYTGVLGMEVLTYTPGQAAFYKLAGSVNDHDLGVFAKGPHAQRPGRQHTGLYHLAWQVDTIDDLAEARQTLLDVGAYVGESSHGTTKSIYATDPDGNEFEVMWIVPRHAWAEARAAASPRPDPLELDVELARWSGVHTAEAIVPVEEHPVEETSR